jgi:hypothetical protein
VRIVGVLSIGIASLRKRQGIQGTVINVSNLIHNHSLIISILLRTTLMSNLLLCKFRGLYIPNQSLVTLDDLHSRFIIGKESSARNCLFIG